MILALMNLNQQLLTKEIEALFEQNIWAVGDCSVSKIKKNILGGRLVLIVKDDGTLQAKCSLIVNSRPDLRCSVALFVQVVEALVNCDKSKI